MGNQELQEVLKNHQLWLDGDDGGERANLMGANLMGANLRGANLLDANLTDANLVGANLRDANLTGANLWGVNLDGANLWGANGNRVNIKSLLLADEYPITYTHDVLQIGCERHLISEWKDFDDKRILEMDSKKALKFWRKYKDFIFHAIELSPGKPTGFEEE